MSVAALEDLLRQLAALRAAGLPEREERFAEDLVFNLRVAVRARRTDSAADWPDRAAETTARFIAAQRSRP